MDWLEFVANVLSVLVWPIAIVLILLVFYPQIQALVPRIKELSAGGFKVVIEASEQVQKISLDIESLAKESTKHREVRLARFDTQGSLLAIPNIETLLANPRGLVRFSWERLVEAMDKALQVQSKEPATNDSDFSAKISRLDSCVWLPARFYIILDRLATAHAQVSKGAEISENEAVAFAKTSEALRRTFVGLAAGEFVAKYSIQEMRVPEGAR